MSNRVMRQEAPYPEELAALVASLQYKPGWSFMFDEDYDRGQGCTGLTLNILIETPNSYNPEQLRQVLHLMPVPAAAYDVRSWQRWLLDQILLVERHEACEFFTVNGENPFAPHHGPGRDPYTIFEVGSTEEVATRAVG